MEVPVQKITTQQPWVKLATPIKTTKPNAKAIELYDYDAYEDALYSYGPADPPWSKSDNLDAFCYQHSEVAAKMLEEYGVTLSELQELKWDMEQPTYNL
jgi:hypothetical protein